MHKYKNVLQNIVILLLFIVEIVFEFSLVQIIIVGMKALMRDV